MVLGVGRLTKSSRQGFANTYPSRTPFGLIQKMGIWCSWGVIGPLDVPTDERLATPATPAVLRDERWDRIAVTRSGSGPDGQVLASS